jgi:hypothetical protein
VRAGLLFEFTEAILIAAIGVAIGVVVYALTSFARAAT